MCYSLPEIDEQPLPYETVHCHDAEIRNYNLIYPNLDSAIRPICNPYLMPSSQVAVEFLETETILSDDKDIEPYNETSLCKKSFNQKELNDLVRDLNLSKDQWQLFIDSCKRSLKCVLLHKTGTNMHQFRLHTQQS